MKFTSIVVALLVAASQNSSTVAQPAAANPDFASSLNTASANIDVIANDFISDNVPASINSRTQLSVATQPVIVSGNGIGGAGTAVVNGVADGTINYFPVAGFVGTITFTYSITAYTGCRRYLRYLSSSSLTGIVTVTVFGEQASGEIPNKVSTADVLKTVRGGLYNAAATQASLQPTTLTALLGPVTATDNADFLAKTSASVVRSAFSIVFSDFSNIGDF